MRAARRVLVAALAMSALGIAGPASAHGACQMSTTTPTYNGVWRWTVQAVCSEPHSDWSITTCLQSSSDPVGATGWTNENCQQRTQSGPTTSMTWNVTATGSCAPLRWYRSYAVASVGSGGAHQGMSATSPATMCISAN